MSLFMGGRDPDVLANKGQYIEFFHLVSGTVVYFRAFLTQFEDQYESEWNEDQVFGRMDPISTFKRTGRKINLGWRVVADSVDSAKFNLAKVGTLMQMLYPSYSGGSGAAASSSTHISGPPLMKLKFMNMITNSVTEGEEGGGDAITSGLLGYVNGFTNAPVLDDGFIEGDAEIFPKTIELSCTFTVLHTHTPGWEIGTFQGGPGFPYGTTVQSMMANEVAAAQGTAALEAAQSVYETYIRNMIDPPPTGPWLDRETADAAEGFDVIANARGAALPEHNMLEGVEDPPADTGLASEGEGDGASPAEIAAQADVVLNPQTAD